MKAAAAGLQQEHFHICVLDVKVLVYQLSTTCILLNCIMAPTPSNKIEPEQGTEEHKKWLHAKNMVVTRKVTKEEFPEKYKSSNELTRIRMRKYRSKKQAVRNAQSYFEGPDNEFSDPTEVGVTLPISILETMRLAKHNNNSVSPPSSPTSSHAQLHDSDTDTDDNSDVADPTVTVATGADAPPSEKVVKFHKMHAFLPHPDVYSSQAPCVMLFFLQQLAAFVKRKQELIMDNQFYGIIHKDDSSECSGIRSINGKRIEIFIDCNRRSNACIETMIQQMIRERSGGMDELQEGKDNVTMGALDKVQARLCLVAYCNKLAMQDPRISEAAPPYVFQNHAIIASYDKAIPQDIHIDLDSSKLYQFGLMITEDSEPTWEYRASKPVMKKNSSLRDIWKTFPANLDKIMWKNDDVKKRLNSFGCLFSEPKQVGVDGVYLPDTSSAAAPRALGVPFPVGTLFSTPGKVPHGGPATDDFRAVLFFTGAPEGKKPYDSDEQFNRSMLLYDMFYLTWMDMSKGQRSVMLEYWYTEGLTKDKSALANIPHNPSRGLGELLLQTKSAEIRKQMMDFFVSFDWTLDEWETGCTDRYDKLFEEMEFEDEPEEHVEAKRPGKKRKGPNSSPTKTKGKSNKK